MPPLTPEEKEQCKGKVEELKIIYANNLSYPYKQGDELRKTRKYRHSQGVCFAMSLDWIRRHLWNIYLPQGAAHRKRNFDDAKYARSEANRKALTMKHGKLQDAYRSQREEDKFSPNVSILARMVEASVVSSGMDKLRIEKTLELHSYELSEEAWAATKGGMGAPNAHYKFRMKLAGVLNEAAQAITPAVPAVGLFIEMVGDEEGHAMAMIVTGTHRYFFDPNLGEYGFTAVGHANVLISFLGSLWFDIYHRFFKMDAVTYSIVRFQ